MIFEKPDWDDFEPQLADFPHHLFMLNKHGQTPLDVAILETISAVETQQKSKDQLKAQTLQKNVENATEKAQLLIARM